MSKSEEPSNDGNEEDGEMVGDRLAVMESDSPEEKD